MFSNNNLISLRQLKLLLILNIFGIGITILPRKVVEFGGQNGWLIILISTIFAGVCIFLINSVASIYPNDDFVSYTSKILGKPLSTLISIGFIIKISIWVALEIRVFSEILKEIMLFNTPLWIISLTMLFLGGFMASKGYESRGRIAEILIFITFIPLIFVFFVAVFDVDFSNLNPFLKDFNIKDFLKGSIYTTVYFSAIEFILLVYPYVKNKKEIKKTTFKSLIFSSFIMIFMSIITIAKFGKYDILNQMWPVLEIMNTIDLPGAFIERQDALTMTFWIISIFMIVNSGIFFSSLIFKDLIKKGTHLIFIIILIPIIYFISLIPKNISDVYNILNLFYKFFGFTYIFIIPLILLIVAKIRGLKSE